MVIMLSMEKMRAAAQRDFVLTWIPVSLFTTLLLTLMVTAYVSTREYGESPCGVWLCDISVYGAYPKNGWSQVFFRGGFILIFLQCLLLCGVRCYEAGLPKAMGLFVLTGVALLVMAFIPCYASAWHFYAAGMTFGFLSIGQWIDTAYDEVAPKFLGILRRIMVVATVGMFGIWFIFEAFEGVSFPILEYSAAVTPFLYFLTWTWETVNRPSGSMFQNFVVTEDEIA